MFEVTRVNYDEHILNDTDFNRLCFNISRHEIFYVTTGNIAHSVKCDFSNIYDEIHSIVSSKEFQEEKPYQFGCDGDWYKFEYDFHGEKKKYEGYIYGLKEHEKLVNLINSCAKETLDDIKRLMKNNCGKKTDGSIGIEEWAKEIGKKQAKLCDSFLDFWEDI